MLRLLAAFALATAPLVLAADTADACSCVARPFSDHAKTEKRVVLARAGKPIKNGDALEQRFTVLATFKGPADPTFTLDRRATPPCATNYKEGEIAILMSSDTQLDPCHGNVSLESMASQFPAIVAATGTARTDAPLPAIEQAIRIALPKFLHQRPEIPVQYRSYAGTSITIDKSKLTFSAAANAQAISLETSFVAANVVFVSGRYKREGVRFTVLLFLENKTWKTAFTQTVEN